MVSAADPILPMSRIGQASDCTRAGWLCRGMMWRHGLKQENIAQGVRVTTAFQLKQMQEHFERLDKCGMPERKNIDRSKLFAMFEMGKAAAAEAGIKF